MLREVLIHYLILVSRLQRVAFLLLVGSIHIFERDLAVEGKVLGALLGGLGDLCLRVLTSDHFVATALPVFERLSNPCSILVAVIDRLLILVGRGWRVRDHIVVFIQRDILTVVVSVLRVRRKVYFLVLLRRMSIL